MYSRRFSIAPMMDYTDRHCRVFMRLISQNTLLYTEMLTDRALIHGDKNRLLDFDAAEHPLALQLGGSDPKLLTQAALIAKQWGYDEINLNVGCPSDRVQSGKFGLCLMKSPELVQECIFAMTHACDLPITVKTRTGVDEQDRYDQLCHFIETVEKSGCQHFTIHARKGWLHGLSPKENRHIPPLDYPRVYQLKKDFPHLEIGINGGVTSLQETQEHLKHVDAVMVGRAAYSNPYLLAEVDATLFDGEPGLTRHQIIQRYLPYIERELALGTKLTALTKPILGLFQGQPGAKSWRRMISENAFKDGMGPGLIERSLPQN